jgi:hypothetical protein
MKLPIGSLPYVTRRLFSLGVAGIATAIAAVTGREQIKSQVAMAQDREGAVPSQTARQGRLLASPSQLSSPADSRAAVSRGTQKLGIGAHRDGLLYIPSCYRADRPAPLVVILHGAGGDAH